MRPSAASSGPSPIASRPHRRRYGDHLSVQTTTLAMDMRKDLVRDALIAVLNPKSITLRNDSPSRKAEGMEPGIELLHRRKPGTFTVEANGLTFEMDLRRPENRPLPRPTPGARGSRETLQGPARRRLLHQPGRLCPRLRQSRCRQGHRSRYLRLRLRRRPQKRRTQRPRNRSHRSQRLRFPESRRTGIRPHHTRSSQFHEKQENPHGRHTRYKEIHLRSLKLLKKAACSPPSVAPTTPPASFSWRISPPPRRSEKVPPPRRRAHPAPRPPRPHHHPGNVLPKGFTSQLIATR